MAKITRRSLVNISAAGLTGCAGAHKGPWRHFTAEEGRLLELICEQIVPTDKDPGAREAGAAQYIDRQLAKRLKAFAEHYRKGLSAIQGASRELRGRNFEQLAWAERTAVLKAVEAGKVNQANWPKRSSRWFFSVVRDHTIEGVFSHPRHGGNRDLAGYRLLGWEYPEPRGQNRYTDPRFRKT
jgi:hypothetical protein